MTLLPTDWVSFLWGAALGGVAAFMGGFLKKAGEHAFTAIASKLNPKEPDPVQVDGHFTPTTYEPGVCAWVRDVRVYEFEQKGYTYYPHPKKQAKCFRMTSDGRDG